MLKNCAETFIYIIAIFVNFLEMTYIFRCIEECCVLELKE